MKIKNPFYKPKPKDELAEELTSELGRIQDEESKPKKPRFTVKNPRAKKVQRTETVAADESHWSEWTPGSDMVREPCQLCEGGSHFRDRPTGRSAEYGMGSPHYGARVRSVQSVGTVIPGGRVVTSVAYGTYLMGPLGVTGPAGVTGPSANPFDVPEPYDPDNDPALD